MRCLIRHQRAVLYLAYSLALSLMFADLYQGCGPTLSFYLMTQAVLVFRVFGVNWLTYLVHVLSLLTLLVYLAAAYLVQYDFVWLLLLSAMALQFVASLHMMVARPGHTYTEYTERVGAHACMGLLTTIVFFWLLCFMAAATWQWLLSKLYMLVFLFIVLTPLFQDTSQANVIVMESRRAESTAEA